MTDLALDARLASVRHALRLEYLTVGWNVVEGVVAVTAAVLAGSVALLGFGIDSFVESTSGSILVWRLLAERRGIEPEAIERIDARAPKLVGASLFLLAGYIAVDASASLWNREAPRPSAIGIALTAVSLVVMQWLAGAKRRAVRRLGSRALEADAFQTTACFLALDDHARRDRAQRRARLVVGRPQGGPRDDLVHREGWRRGVARRGGVL